MTAAAQKVDPLDLLFVRSCAMAERVVAGEIPFIAAVDFMWEAAEFAGTVDRVGPDLVQHILATAFMGVRPA
jgi:hypothetical protein